jgi:HPr kinase/phosphorylase
MGEAPRILVHATSVVLGAAARPFGGPENIAVLLLGESGSGKSEIALRLIAAGAILLADDQTALGVREGRLFAEAPERTGGLIEIRGVGIIRLDVAEPAPVAIAVRLEPKARIARLPEPETYNPPSLALAAPPPLIVLAPFEAATPAKIQAAACAAVLGRFVAGVAPSK